KPEDLTVRVYRHRRDGGNARERAGHPQIDAIRGSIDRSARHNRVLPRDAVENLLRGDTKRGELGVAKLDEDFLWSLANDVDLVHVGNPQQTLTNVLRAVFELGERQAVGSEHVERRIDIAEFIVEIRASDAGGKLVLDIADLLSDLIPEILHLCGRSRIRQDHLKKGTARLRIGLDTIEIWQLLQFLLDLVSDLRLHLICGRARPADANHHDLNGEVRILRTSEVDVGIDAGGAQENDYKQHQRLVRDRPFREIKPFHDAPFHLRVG